VSQLDDLPPLRDVIAAHGLAALKSLGQNFLLDLNLTSRIARASGDLTNSIVYEVGPGPGGLTRGLLVNGAKRVVAVEQDRRALDALAEISAASDGRLTIIQGDALKANELALIGDPQGADIRIAANLPYNIGTALLLKWLTVEPWLPWYKSMTLMFQKEVGQRIVAEPGSKAYGRLSVISQFRCHTRIHFDVAPQAFVPAPKVTSCVVGLIPKPAPENAPSIKALEATTAAAFGQRRKMLRASLKTLVSDPLSLLEEAAIIPTKRAEELTLDDFCRLAKAYQRASA
jgi:16S rRNA (adenine1518-N6/adenine1519-N6)-dimethyltransferase